MATKMKKDTWIYLGGMYGAWWGILLPSVASGFAIGAVLVLREGYNRGGLLIACLLIGIAAFLLAFCISLRDRFYSWAKPGRDGIFVWTILGKKRYQRYDRYRDGGICQYVHEGPNAENSRRMLWIYLTCDAMRPLYLRNINRMPISSSMIRLPYNEERFAYLVSVLPEELANKMRIRRAKLLDVPKQTEE